MNQSKQSESDALTELEQEIRHALGLKADELTPFDPQIAKVRQKLRTTQGISEAAGKEIRALREMIRVMNDKMGVAIQRARYEVARDALEQPSGGFMHLFLEGVRDANKNNSEET